MALLPRSKSCPTSSSSSSNRARKSYTNPRTKTFLASINGSDMAFASHSRGYLPRCQGALTNSHSFVSSTSFYDAVVDWEPARMPFPEFDEGSSRLLEQMRAEEKKKKNDKNIKKDKKEALGPRGTPARLSFWDAIKVGLGARSLKPFGCCFGRGSGSWGRSGSKSSESRSRNKSSNSDRSSDSDKSSNKSEMMEPAVWMLEGCFEAKLGVSNAVGVVATAATAATAAKPRIPLRRSGAIRGRKPREALCRAGAPSRLRMSRDDSDDAEEASGSVGIMNTTAPAMATAKMMTTMTTTTTTETLWRSILRREHVGRPTTTRTPKQVRFSVEDDVVYEYATYESSRVVCAEEERDAVDGE